MYLAYGNIVTASKANKHTNTSSIFSLPNSVVTSSIRPDLGQHTYMRERTTIIFSMSMLSARYLSNALALLYTTCNSSRPNTEQLPSYKNHINIYCGIWIIGFIRQIGHWKNPPSPTSWSTAALLLMWPF